MNLHQSLKAQTAQLHNEIEKDLNLLRQDFSLRDYETVLKRFYRFYISLEDSLRKSNYAMLLEKRSKTELLLKDLSFFGIRKNELEGTFDKVALPLNSPEEILGAFYVLEGSTLGGRVLTQHFSSKFDFSPEGGINFFNGYGDKTGLYWKEYLEFMDKEWKEKKLNEELIISSAQKTFQVLHQWLTEKELNEQ